MIEVNSSKGHDNLIMLIKEFWEHEAKSDRIQKINRQSTIIFRDLNIPVSIIDGTGK